MEKSELKVTGLLLVHGIGSQARASVLTSSCDALVAWLRHRHGSDEVTYAGAELGLGENASAGPAHVRLEVPGATWLVAESRWADSFIQPTSGRVTSWTIGAVLTAVEHETRQLLSEGALPSGPDNGDVFDTLRPDTTRFGKQARHTKATVVVAMLPLVLAGLVASSLLRLIPQLRVTVARIQSVMTATIGDSYVFVSGLTGRAAITQQVRCDIDWMLAQGVSKLVVAAHSQGAAVTHAALQEWGCTCTPAPSDPRTCPCAHAMVELLTYGSGLDKITALIGSDESDHRSRIRRWLLPIVGVFTGVGLGAVVAAIADALTQETTDAAVAALWIATVSTAFFALAGLIWAAAIFATFWRFDGATTVAAGLFAVITIVPLGMAVWRSPELGTFGILLTLTSYACMRALFLGTGPRASRNSRPARARQWWDVRSTSDPVASSSGSEIAGRRDLTVHNLRSVAFDHTSYWDNWSEFIPIVINTMALGPGLEPGGADSDRSAERSAKPMLVPRFWTARERSRRYEWTWILADTRVWLTLVCISVLTAALTSLEALGGAVLGAYEVLVNWIPGQAVSLSDSGARLQSIVGAISIVLGFALVYRLSSGGWHAWQALSQRRLVNELQQLEGVADEWASWLAAVRCEERTGSAPTSGWLVLRKRDDSPNLCFFADPRPTQPTDDEWEGAVSLGLSKGTFGVAIRVGDGQAQRRFSTRSVRAAMHLDRVANVPDHR